MILPVMLHLYSLDVAGTDATFHSFVETELEHHLGALVGAPVKGIPHTFPLSSRCRLLHKFIVYASMHECSAGRQAGLTLHVETFE